MTEGAVAGLSGGSTAGYATRRSKAGMFSGPIHFIVSPPLVYAARCLAKRLEFRRRYGWRLPTPPGTLVLAKSAIQKRRAPQSPDDFPNRLVNRW